MATYDIMFAMVKGAAVSCLILGLGFGLPGMYGVWHLARTGRIARFLGFPTYGDGLFTRHGVETTVPLLVGFVVICVAEVIAGWMLWDGRRSGAIACLALLPAELLFWIGFSLPFGPVLGATRTVLLVLAWSSLR